ncbi:MAG: ribbon-helix-helix protein, CopG family [Vicinamibacterales bacterium]
MTARKRPLCTFTLDPDLVEGLEHLRKKDGTPASETVRRALRAWFARKDVLLRVGDLGVFADDGELPPATAMATPHERALDEGDLYLILRALRRLRVSGPEDGRRRRLIAQVSEEIDEFLSRGTVEP